MCVRASCALLTRRTREEGKRTPFSACHRTVDADPTSTVDFGLASTDDVLPVSSADADTGVRDDVKSASTVDVGLTSTVDDFPDSTTCWDLKSAGVLDSETTFW